MNRREAIAALVALPEVARISKASLKPEDVLVIELDGHPSEECCRRLEMTMKSIWPSHKCVVLTEGATLKVVGQ